MDISHENNQLPFMHGVVQSVGHYPSSQPCSHINFLQKIEIRKYHPAESLPCPSNASKQFIAFTTIMPWVLLVVTSEQQYNAQSMRPPS
jgi:hypothetical protein